jgi:streptogramin lyase
MTLLTLRRFSAVLGLATVLVLGVAASALGAPKVDGTFPLKSELETNNKLVVGPEGDIWVTLANEEEDVARITPAGAVDEFDLGAGVKRPSGIALGPEGNIWVSQEKGVAKFSPANPKGTAKAFAIAEIGSFNSIVKGPDNNMWVATEEKAIRFSPADPEGTVKPVAIPNLSPRDIDVAGSLLVIADANQAAARIVTLTTSGVEKDYPIDGGSQGVAGAPSGQIGFSQQVPKTGPEQVGLITPPNPAQAQTQPDDPFGVAFGSDQAFWIVRAGMNGGLARLTSSGQLTLLGGFPAGRTARQIVAGPNNTLWVTTEKNLEPGAIVRVSGLEPPVTNPVPQTSITKGPRVVRTAKRTAKVRFRFKSDVAGSTFQCALTKLRKGRKQAKPSFKTCKSPKTYRLRPGRYRFQVRAVAAGGTDATPATRTVKIVHIHRHRRHR